MSEFDPVAVARAWRRPYTSVQWAWVKALGIAPSDRWDAERKRVDRKLKRREVREAMGQRYGVRGL